MLLQGSTATAPSSQYSAGLHCSVCPEPPTWVFCRSSSLAHNTLVSLHISSVSLLLELCQWMLTQSPQPAWTTLAHEQLTKATCKTLSETSHTSPTCVLQPVQEEKCLYLCIICITSYCSQQEVFSGLQEKNIWASRGSTAMAEECWMLLPTQAKPSQALRCQATEEDSRVEACPILLQIRPRIRWNCLAPLQPSSAQSPASAWSWKSAQTTSCVSLSVAKITCKQTKNHLKLSFPTCPDLPARLHFKARWCGWDQMNTNILPV